MTLGIYQNLTRLLFLSCILFIFPSISNADTSNSTRIGISVVIQNNTSCLFKFSAKSELASRNYSRLDSTTCDNRSVNTNEMIGNVESKKVLNSGANYTRLVSVVQ